MNSKEFMKAVGGISDETIAKYAEVSPVIVKGKTEKGVKSMKNLSIWLSAAAAALVLGVGIFAVSRFVKNPGTEHNVAVPTAAPTGTSEKDDPTAPAEVVACSVLEVKNPQLADSPFVHMNEIEETAIVSVDETKQNSTKTVEFMGKQYDVIYKQTIYYLLGNTTIDQFSVAGNTADSLLLLPDGTVYAALISPVITLDIDEHADKETVRAAVEAAFWDEIDFAEFEFCDIEGSLEDTTEGFGLYTFHWYNKKLGMMTGETVQITVRQNGEAGAVWMKNRVDLDLDELSDDLSINDFSTAIEEKLREIYGNAMTDHEIMDALLTNYEGKPCFEVTVGVRYAADNGDQYSEACKLAVVIGESSVSCDYPAAIMVDGTVYYRTGRAMPVEPDESAIRYTTSYAENGVPSKDGEDNFNRKTGTPYAVFSDGTVVVLIDNEWIEFCPEIPYS